MSARQGASVLAEIDFSSNLRNASQILSMSRKRAIEPDPNTSTNKLLLLDIENEGMFLTATQITDAQSLTHRLSIPKISSRLKSWINCSRCRRDSCHMRLSSGTITGTPVSSCHSHLSIFCKSRSTNVRPSLVDILHATLPEDLLDDAPAAFTITGHIGTYPLASAGIPIFTLPSTSFSALEPQRRLLAIQIPNWTSGTRCEL